MSDVIGRGVIEVTADSSRLRAGIDEAKRSINGMGDAVEKAAARSSRAIDRYIKDLQTQSATVGMSARDADRYKLALRGATAEQLAAADAAHKLTEAHERGQVMSQRFAIGMAALAGGAIAAYAAFDSLVKKAGDFQDLAEKTGDSAQNIASLSVAAATAGIEMDAVGGLAIKLSKNLVGVDDESAAAGSAIKALGLSLDDLKKMAAADRLDAIAKAFAGFADGAEKGDVAIALFGKAGAEALPFFKELGQEGARQVILTNEQIAAADDYADSQAKLREQLSLHAQSIATEMLPALTEFKKAISDIASDQEHSAVISEVAKAALGGLINVFQALTVFGSDVAFVFQSVGREISAIAAQMTALAHLDFRGFSAISDAVTEDAKLARAELDRFQARILAIGQEKDKVVTNPADNNYIETADSVRRKKLVFNGAAPKAAKVADPNKLLNAQRDLDIANIRKSGAEQIEAYSNTERVMQALYAAGLYNEDEYYSAKRRFIESNTAAQEKALNDEIDRLEQENRAGKNKLENDKKIVEAQAKLQKLQADGRTALEINAIQQASANEKIARSYVDATEAAAQYIETIRKQAALDMGGIGKGNKFRQDQGARAQIADRRDSKADGYGSDLRNGKITQDQYDKYLAIVQDTYAQEVQAYNDRTAAINTAQGDWLTGASDAWENYLAKAQDVASQSSDAFTSAFEGMTNGVADSIAKTIAHGDNLGESLKAVALSIGENFISAFIKIGIQKLLADKVAAGAFAGTIAAQSQAMVAMAGLNAFASTAAIPIVGPALAPAAAAGATAAAEAMAILATSAASLSVLSAAGGMDIPAGVNPLTQLHEKEMVLPAQHADTIRRLGSMGDGGSTGGAVTLAPVYNIKIDGTTDMARNQQMVRSAVMQGNADLVDKLQRAGRI